MSQLACSSSRFMGWGKDNAQFLSIIGVSAVNLCFGGNIFLHVLRDLEHERELRKKDVATQKELLKKEEELRRMDVEKALAQGRAEVTQNMLVYGKWVLELQHSGEYKGGLWRPSPPPPKDA